MRKLIPIFFFLVLGFSCTTFAQGKNLNYGNNDKEIFKNKYFDIEIYFSMVKKIKI